MTTMPDVKQIVSKILERPDYRHEHWEEPYEWISDNLDRLGNYYIDQAKLVNELEYELAQELVAHYLYVSDEGRKHIRSDFAIFCLCQHDLCTTEAEAQLARWDAERQAEKDMAQASRQW